MAWTPALHMKWFCYHRHTEICSTDDILGFDFCCSWRLYDPFHEWDALWYIQRFFTECSYWNELEVEFHLSDARHLTIDNVVVQDKARAVRGTATGSDKQEWENGILHHRREKLCYWCRIGERRVARTAVEIFQHSGTLGIVLAVLCYNQWVSIQEVKRHTCIESQSREQETTKTISLSLC